MIQLDLETKYLKTKNMIAFFSVIVATVAMQYTRFRLEQTLITLTAHTSTHPLIHPPTYSPEVSSLCCKVGGGHTRLIQYVRHFRLFVPLLDRLEKPLKALGLSCDEHVYHMNIM